MTHNAHILGALQREFRAPAIDPEWVDACVSALLENGMEASVEQVRDQYLYSDLAASTVPPGAIPETAHDIILFPQPTLLQIVSLTEIGSSAFQLQTVLDQRKEVISGATRIRRMDEEEDGEGGGGGGGQDEDDNKMPQYPRGMLKMELTDGSRVMKAIEYKRIGGLKLGETCLGSKLLLHRVKALRGTLLLTPSTAQCLGYEVAAFEAEQPAKFLQSLLQRLGRAGADEGREGGGAARPVRAGPSTTAGRRTAAVPPTATRPPAAAAARATATATPRPVSVINTTSRLTIPPRPSPVNSTPGPSRLRNGGAPAQVASPYFASTGNGVLAAKSDSASARKRPRASDTFTIDDDADEYDDSFLQHLEEAEAQASRLAHTAPAVSVPRVGQRPIHATGYVDIDEDGDDDWFAEIDIDQLSGTQSRRGASSSRNNVPPPEAEVIEISD